MLLLLIIVVILVLLWLAENETINTSWYRHDIRKVSPEWLGEMGECQLIRKLSGCLGQGRILHHVYVPLKNGGVTEIDVILINENGIAVFENKHYSGTVYGNYSDPCWRHLFEGRSYDIYSPVLQNRNHIKALTELPGMQNYKNVVYGIVTFSGKEEFKVNRLDRDKDKVCHISHVCEIVKKRTPFLTKQEIEKIYQAILPLTQATKEQKQNHIYAVSHIRTNSSFQ